MSEPWENVSLLQSIENEHPEDELFYEEHELWEVQNNISKSSSSDKYIDRDNEERVIFQNGNSQEAQVSRKFVMPKLSRNLSFDDGDDERWVPRLQKKRPKLQRRYVLFIGVTLLVILAIGIVHLSYQLSPAKREALVPPNPEVPLPPSPSIEQRFSSAAVCSDGAPCSSIGRDILKKNGSAIDAAIATLFCNGIVNGQSMGLGGGFLMTLYKRDIKKVITLNARESAPARAHVGMFNGDQKRSRTGPLAIGVPGELKGYWEAHKRYGVLPWAEVIAPSIKLCEEGYNMTKHQYDSLVIRSEEVHANPVLREIFVDPNTGLFKKAGSIIHRKKLCSTLRTIAEKGGDDLYNGSLAKLLADDIMKMGGIITEDDLKNYSVKWSDPVSVTLQNDNKLYSVPPPGSGILLVFIMNILDGYKFSPKSISTINDTIVTYHRITEAFKYAFAKRTKFGDPDYVNITKLMNDLTSKEYSNIIRNRISDNTTNNDPESYGAMFYNQEDHGTAHISIIAPNGDAVSVTSTVNIYFGAGVASEKTGIILNSGMDDFSSQDFKNYFGLPGSPANAIAPGKRSLSSMTPSILVDKNGDVRLVIGASGGTKITTATAYVIMRHVWFGETIKQAVDASRIHHQLYPMKLSYEYGVLNQVVEGLQKLGHNTTRYRDRGSIICAIAKLGNILFANADYRKGGEVFGLN